MTVFPLPYPTISESQSEYNLQKYRMHYVCFLHPTHFCFLHPTHFETGSNLNPKHINFQHIDPLLILSSSKTQSLEKSEGWRHRPPWDQPVSCQVIPPVPMEVKYTSPYNSPTFQWYRILQLNELTITIYRAFKGKKWPPLLKACQ